MAEVNHCPQCGCDMPPDSPAGLCPDCLLGAGLAVSDPVAGGQRLTEAANVAAFVPPKPQQLADRFPQFEILDLLGYGGMGAVYKARQKSLDRLVALKIIKPDAAHDSGFADRFEREAKALAKLNHAKIVSVYDSGESDGLYYFVMEYVDGTNLRRLIESKELSPEQAMTVIPQICEALQYAHDEGIVHRDIKPENILVDSRGDVRIADFGLAKLLGKTSLNHHTLTGTHQVMGTPRYMAPEQMEGSKAVDHRADIYSLGVVFYEMLTGEIPMGSFEPPSRKAPVDGRLDEVVLRSLAKEPERRYQHASDVGIDIEAIQSPLASAKPVAAYGPPVAGSSLPTRFSRKAIIGACWAPLFFFGLVLLMAPVITLRTSPSGEPAPLPVWFYVIALPVALCGLVGLAAPFGTTILGFVAMHEIRQPHSRLRGLGLAFFDAVLFPLLVFDILLGVCVFQAASAVLPGEKTAVLFAPVVLVLLLANIAFLVWSWRHVSRTGQQPVDPESPPTDWSPLVFGLVVAVPLMALMSFGIQMTESAWVLAALAFPWLCLGIAAIAADGKPTEKAVTWLAAICFLLSLALIAHGIVVEQSAWPLAGLAVGLVAAFLGMFLGELGRDENETDQVGEAIVQTADQIKGHVAKQVKAATGQLEAAAADDDEEEEDSPEETLQWTAWWIGAVGLFRSWQLFENSFWSDMLASFGDGEFDTVGRLLLALTGPVILIAAIGVHHAKHFMFGVAACILCMLSGSCVAVVIGVWSLVTLFDPKIQALFIEAASAPTPASGNSPAKPVIPYGYGNSIGSTLTEAWTHWWRERDSLFTRVVQLFLLLLHIVCLLAFLGFRGSGTPTTPWHYQFKHEIGFPSPWFTVEQVGGAEPSFSHDVHWSSPAWIVAAVGFAICYVYCRIERVRNPAAGYWYRLEAFLLVWGVLALMSIGLAMGLGYLSTTFSSAEQVAGSAESESPVNAPAEMPAAVPDSRQAAAQSSTPSQLRELMAFASSGRIGRIRELIAAGADVNDKDADGQTALMKTAAGGHVSAALSLLVMGANANEKDNSGMTALMYATEAGHADIIRAFSKLQLAARQALSGDASPQEAAAKFKQTAGVSVALLEEYGHRAINLEIDVDAQDDRGETALIKAASRGDWECLTALQAGVEGLNADGGMEDKRGRNALMHLAANGHTDCIRQAIRDRNWTLSDGDISYRFNQLLDPEYVSSRDSESKNAIELATENNQGEIADLLRAEMHRCLQEGPALYKAYARRALGEGYDAGEEHQRLTELIEEIMFDTGASPTN